MKLANKLILAFLAVGLLPFLLIALVSLLNAQSAMRAQAYPAEDPATLRTPAEILGTYLYLLGPDSREENGRSFDAQPPAS
mgnify:CR=1 FL=1